MKIMADGGGVLHYFHGELFKFDHIFQSTPHASLIHFDLSMVRYGQQKGILIFTGRNEMNRFKI